MQSNNINIIEKDYGICINNPNYFLAINDFTISNGFDVVENVNIVKDMSIFNPKDNDDAFIAQKVNSIDYFSNTYDDLTILTFMENDLFVQDFTDKLQVVNTDKGFENARINLSNVVYINKAISKKDLLKIYNLISKAKSKYLSSLALPIHIQNILNTNDFLAVLANVSSNDDTFDKVDFDELNIIISDAIEINLEDAFKKLKLNFGILDYFVSEGILIGDLVDAGLELIAGVEATGEIREKLEAQILKSLTDIKARQPDRGVQPGPLFRLAPPVQRPPAQVRQGHGLQRRAEDLHHPGHRPPDQGPGGRPVPQGDGRPGVHDVRDGGGPRRP